MEGAVSSRLYNPRECHDSIGNLGERDNITVLLRESDELVGGIDNNMKRFGDGKWVAYKMVVALRGC